MQENKEKICHFSLEATFAGKLWNDILKLLKVKENKCVNVGFSMTNYFSGWKQFKSFSVRQVEKFCSNRSAITRKVNEIFFVKYMKIFYYFQYFSKR